MRHCGHVTGIHLSSRTSQFRIIANILRCLNLGQFEFTADNSIVDLFQSTGKVGSVQLGGRLEDLHVDIRHIPFADEAGEWFQGRLFEFLTNLYRHLLRLLRCRRVDRLFREHHSKRSLKRTRTVSGRLFHNLDPTAEFLGLTLDVRDTV